MAEFGWNAGERRWLDIGGRRLEAVGYGPPPDAAPTLVLLHEGLGCVSMWRDFPKSLADRTGFGVFAWSRAGYGASDPVELPRPIDYMSREAFETLPGVLDAIGLRRGVLLGHSDGASIAAIYAGGVVDFRIRGVVLMAPHFFAEPLGLESIRQARTAYETGDLRERLARRHAHVDVAFRGWCDAWLDPRFAQWNIADHIDYLRVPTLAIQGAEDEYGTPRQIEELIARSYAPVEAHILPDCRHQPHLERPERTLSLIADFCARLERIERAGGAAL